MNGKQLKNSILQWAIQGKLVPQDPNDEPASVLLERIRAEKARLIKEGKIKKDKNETIIFRGDDNSHYEKLPNGEVRCIDSEIPFEIPSNWCWVRFFSAYNLETNLVNPKQYLDYFHVAPDNIIKAQGKLLKCNTVGEDKVKSNNHLFHKGHIVYSKIRPLLRKAIIAPFDGLCSADMYPLSTIMNLKFALYYLLSDAFNNQVSSICSSRVKMPKINKEELATIIVPFPPLAEQERIVTKLEELWPIIDQYNNAQSVLDQLNAALIQCLRKSILQEAIQGKLVEQCDTEEPASQLLARISEEKKKLLKEGVLKKKDLIESHIFKGDDNKYYEQIGGKCIDISEEIPFDIPENWSWCRLSQCCVRIFSGKSPSYSKTPTKHLIIGQQANQWERIEMQYAKYGTDDYAKNIEEYQYLLDGDVLLNTLGNGTLGRCGIFENISDKVLTDGHLFVFRTIEKSLARYILYYLTLNYTEINRKADGSTNQTFLNLKKVSNYLIPLPPLNEIKRIVAKKEELDSKL